MRLQQILIMVLCAGVHSLSAARKSYDRKIDKYTHEDDDGRGLQIDWTAFAQELAEKNKPTPAPTRAGSWGIITRVPTNQIEQLEEKPVRTRFPTKPPSRHPTRMPTTSPSEYPTLQPSTTPSVMPSVLPTTHPSLTPSRQPTSNPSDSPSESPTTQPSVSPSDQPTGAPSDQPSATPTSSPSSSPSNKPTSSPSESPSYKPSASPSSQPTNVPSASPSASPTSQPSATPSSQPTSAPSASPSIQPTSAAPSTQPTEDNEVQVILKAGIGPGSNDGVKFTVLGSTVVIIVSALIVRRGLVWGQGDGDNEEEEEEDIEVGEEGDFEEEEDDIDEEPENQEEKQEEEELQRISHLEEGRDNGRPKIAYPLPPSAAIDTRTYKSKERSGLAPFHNMSSRRQSNNLSPIYHYG